MRVRRSSRATSQPRASACCSTSATIRPIRFMSSARLFAWRWYHRFCASLARSVVTAPGLYFKLPAPFDEEGLQVRCGLNAGEPIEEDGDLFGSTVIVASRLAALAGPGEILIPEPLRHLLSGKSYHYADRGDAMLKGMSEPVRLYEVRWKD